MAYAYDSAGNRSSLTVTGGESYVTSYTYDRNNRLLKSSRKNSGAGYADTVIYTYDNNGNQIRKDMSRENLTGKPELGFFADSGDSGYGYEIFTYNGLNQLVKLEDEMKNTAEYTYMANGLRFSKSVKGNKTSFLWDGDGLMMTVTADEIRSYAKSPGYMRTGTSKELSSHNTKLYIFNGHGDVAGMTDKSGNLEKTYSYDAFGNELNPDSSDTNPFRYCGEYYDDELESIYLRARNYNPSTGRFTTEDPIKDGLNWYAYCGGNPVMFVDPSGLDDVMLSYIAKKNGGIVNPSYDEQGYLKSVTVQIKNKIKTYSVGNDKAQVRVVNGRAIIDNNILKNDFSLFNIQTLHIEGDLFDSEEDAALAFALMYYPKSMSEEQEYGALIKERDGKYIFDDVSNSMLSEKNKNHVTLSLTNDTTAIIHIHWQNVKYAGDFSYADDYMGMEKKRKNMYLVNAVKEIKYTESNSGPLIFGYTKSKTLFSF
ncbi:MAG: RHS repeat-associated core domain-containing protein [Clostridia bacterium]|nr:RHS repeat-associated core domain-containing protein [Clostridia bacterium]